MFRCFLLVSGPFGRNGRHHSLDLSSRRERRWAVGDGGFVDSSYGRRIRELALILYSVYPVDADNVWIAGAGGTILHTSNAGQTWSPQASVVTTRFDREVQRPQ